MGLFAVESARSYGDFLREYLSAIHVFMANNVIVRVLADHSLSLCAAASSLVSASSSGFLADEQKKKKSGSCKKRKDRARDQSGK